MISSYHVFFVQVNIVPVIAKADTLTAEECQKFKKTVSVCIIDLLYQSQNAENYSYLHIVEG